MKKNSARKPVSRARHGGSLLKAGVTGCIALLLSGCGDSGSCSSDFLLNDPSGRWVGVLARIESDCGTDTYGSQLNVDHDVSTQCNTRDESAIVLYNEDNLEFTETSYSSLGGGSFAVQNESVNITTDIEYDNFEGELADVTQKVRRYSNGRIVCSEKYVGEARR